MWRKAPVVPGLEPKAIECPVAAGSTDLTSQDHKLAFLNGAIDRRTTSPDRIQPAASPYVLQADAVIPASLITGMRSDLQVTAQVTEDVYDSPTGKILLIPRGARLVGQYDAQIAFGQSRALLVWNRLITVSESISGDLCRPIAPERLWILFFLSVSQ